MTSSKALDQIIEKWVAQNSNKDLQTNYSKRKKEQETWNESRKYLTIKKIYFILVHFIFRCYYYNILRIKDVQEGDELDVRDTEYTKKIIKIKK